MTDYLLTAALLTLLFLVVIITRNSDSSKATFFSKKYTTALKGVCSIVVIFIHIPDAYQNPLQENVGRFAYIAVTLFFMISAYGMQLGLRKPCYLKHFWRNRLSSLLIPCLVVNLTWFCFSVGTTGSSEWLSLLSINDYVKQLIGYCAIFYIVYRLEQGGGYTDRQEYILCLLVFIGSIILYFIDFGWQVPSLGLIYGLLLARHKNQFINFLGNRLVIKIITSSLLSVILGLIYMKYKSIAFFGDFVIRAFLGIAIILLLFHLTVKLKTGNKISAFLGKISFEIYLSHPFVMMALQSSQWNLAPGEFLMLTIAITIAISAILHSVSQTIVDRIRI